MSSFKTIDDLDVAGKRVLVRLDMNVPMRDGRVTDTTRIDRSTDTIRDLTAAGAAVIVISHFGRPHGQVVPEMSLQPVARVLSEALNRDVSFATDCIGPEAEAAAGAVAMGGVTMLENLRFHKGEKKGDADFAAQLASLADAYCNNAFGTCHREDASMVAVPNAIGAAGGDKVVPLTVNAPAQRSTAGLNSAPHTAMHDPPAIGSVTDSYAAAKLADRLTMLVVALVSIAILLACILGVLLTQGAMRRPSAPPTEPADAPGLVAPADEPDGDV